MARRKVGDIMPEWSGVAGEPLADRPPDVQGAAAPQWDLGSPGFPGVGRAGASWEKRPGWAWGSVGGQGDGWSSR